MKLNLADIRPLCNSCFYLNKYIIWFVPTGNTYFLITVTFGHINKADADERWGSQKRNSELWTSSQTVKRPSPGINISEKNENIYFYI